MISFLINHKSNSAVRRCSAAKILFSSGSIWFVSCADTRNEHLPHLGILSAYITAEAQSQGLSTCILGWFDDKKIRKICGIETPVRLVVSLGYAKEGSVVPTKKRKDYDVMVSEV